MTMALKPKIEQIAPSALRPYDRNSRTHSDAQVAQIAASIREFGFTNPVLIDGDGVIVAGHGRVLAAIQIGLEHVPCLRLSHLTPDQVRAYVIADNKLALNAGWDEDLLRLELTGLAGSGFDLSLTGFSEDELASLTLGGSEGLTDPDAVPEPPAEPVSVLGDTWLLGNHRLRCGDSTSADDVAALLGAVKPHLMVTDPPYGVNYEPSWRNAATGSQSARTGTVLNDDRADWREAWALFPGDVAYVWHADKHSTTVATSLEAAGFAIRSQIIWAKDRLILSRGDYHYQHEHCWYAVRSKGHWSGDRKQSTLWQIASRDQDAATIHGTQKPVECMRRPIVNNSSPGQAVYEPFSGSGSTIIAGEMEGRHVYAMELSPAYVDVAIRRWQEFTGREAVLEATGETFAATTTARSKRAA